MTINEYKRRVIKLFKDTEPTDEQYEAMAESVLWMSESDNPESVMCIDVAILSPNPMDENARALIAKAKGEQQ